MKYTNPEITALGDAAQVIQQVGKEPITGVDTFNPSDPRLFQPAYDLDE